MARNPTSSKVRKTLLAGSMPCAFNTVTTEKLNSWIYFSLIQRNHINQRALSPEFWDGVLDM
jgi:hypothetical protein